MLADNAEHKRKEMPKQCIRQMKIKLLLMIYFHDLLCKTVKILFACFQCYLALQITILNLYSITITIFHYLLLLKNWF